ncbi:MAG: hypothetical protein WD043_07975 [Gemmatimonadales bacterium]
MVTIMSLWLPILLSAVGVFIVSSIIHMLLGYHASDFAAVPNEAQARAAIGALNIPPGDYSLPKASSMKEMGDPAFVEKMTKGPVLMMTVFPNGSLGMGKQLTHWFLFSVVIAVFAAYLASRTLEPGAEYLAVFRVVGAFTFAAYGLGEVPASIWYRRKWSSTAKNLFDALLYGLVTAGVFGWLWPG